MSNSSSDVNAFRRGELIVISGPSGVGKGTICKRIMDNDPLLKLSVSATTRKARPGETDGVQYYFVSNEEFERMIERNELLEYMCVFGMSYYGTPKKRVDEMISAGCDVILEIDVNGAMNIKRMRPEAILIFIAPPSLYTLKQRLEGRGTETPEQIEKRYSKAKDEIAYMPEYDYIVVNDDLDKAVGDVESIIKADRLRVARCERLDAIIKED